jgi:hypothetical protein
VLFQIWVSRNGGDPKKITAVEMASAQAGDALRAKQIDGAVVVEPFLTRIVQGDIGKIGFRLTDGLPGPVIAISLRRRNRSGSPRMHRPSRRHARHSSRRPSGSRPILQRRVP